MLWNISDQFATLCIHGKQLHMMEHLTFNRFQLSLTLECFKTNTMKHNANIGEERITFNCTDLSLFLLINNFSFTSSTQSFCNTSKDGMGSMRFYLKFWPQQQQECAYDWGDILQCLLVFFFSKIYFI